MPLVPTIICCCAHIINRLVCRQTDRPSTIIPSLAPPTTHTRMRTREKYGWLARLGGTLNTDLQLKFINNQNPFTITLTAVSINTTEELDLGFFINSDDISFISRATSGTYKYVLLPICIYIIWEECLHLPSVWVTVACVCACPRYHLVTLGVHVPLGYGTWSVCLSAH